MKRCSTCKHFVIGQIGKTNSECRFYPPQTSVFVVGMTAQGPALHKEVSFPITLPEWCCGQWTLKLHEAMGADIEVLPPLRGTQAQ